MQIAHEIETLIRARYPLLYIVTSEETRVRDLLRGRVLCAQPCVNYPRGHRCLNSSDVFCRRYSMSPRGHEQQCRPRPS